jgi:hypothetical protein
MQCGIPIAGRVKRFLTTLVLTGSLVALFAGQAIAGTDLTVTGERRTGDYGTGSSQDSHSVALVLVHGGRVQFHAYLPALHLETTGSTVWTGLGPAPVPPGGNRERNGNGGNRQGTENGSGNRGRGSAAPAVAADPLVGSGSVTTAVSGVGDLRVGVGGRLLGKPAGLYRLDADLTLKAPTADEEKGLGTGEWDARIGFLGERRFWTFTAFGSLGWTRFGDPGWADFNDAMDFFGGVESEPLGPGLLVSGWLDANSEVYPGAGERLVVGGTVRTARRSSWKVSVFAGLTDAAEDFGFALGYTFEGKARRARAIEVAR